MLTQQPGEEASVRGDRRGQGRPVEGKEGQWSKPTSTGCAVCSASDPSRPWRLLWRGRPLHPQPGGRRMGPWSRRRLRLQAGWQLLWDGRLPRDLSPIFHLVACRRGRHRDAQVMADDLIGSDLGDANPEVAIGEVCGRAVHWPNGVPKFPGRGAE
jgi:hypothetical protein